MQQKPTWFRYKVHQWICAYNLTHKYLNTYWFYNAFLLSSLAVDVELNQTFCLNKKSKKKKKRKSVNKYSYEPFHVDGPVMAVGRQFICLFFIVFKFKFNSHTVFCRYGLLLCFFPLFSFCLFLLFTWPSSLWIFGALKILWFYFALPQIIDFVKMVFDFLHVLLRSALIYQRKRFHLLKYFTVTSQSF